MVWDILFGTLSDADLAQALAALTPEAIDQGCEEARKRFHDLHRNPHRKIAFCFWPRQRTLSHRIGVLIFTHHRLPEGGSDHLTALACRHVNANAPLCQDDLVIAKGRPFWHEGWWMRRLQRETALLSAGLDVSGTDIALRAALMLADHLGSASKERSGELPDHLANTMDKTPGSREKVAADSLSKHVQRIYAHARGAFDLLHRYRDRFPALLENQIPADVILPRASADPRFRWQAEAAYATRTMCERNEGGFFACLLSGTGTGKTRGAPTILANAALADARPERRFFRMSLALGLRVLATQSAREYVDDLDFRDEDVSVLVGQPPIRFAEEVPNDEDGSESLIELPEWLRVEQVTGGVPEEGSEREMDWLRSLSVDTDRGLPAFCDMIIEVCGKREDMARRLLASPIMVGTIDHLMGIAAPINSRFLIQSVRLLTSDLVLDEIDQFDGEDIAAIGRLIFQAGSAGRRVIIMSATLTPDIAEVLHEAYARGWTEFARSWSISAHVNLLCTGDAPGSWFTNEGGSTLQEVLCDCRCEVLHGIRSAPVFRRGEILPPCEKWADLVRQIDTGCSRMHELNSVTVDRFRISVGMVRMTRISHTVALAAQLPSGGLRSRLRVKLCLHSQFPRLHRAWIETRLKRALTRKGNDPEAGIRLLCQTEDQNLFEHATKIGVSDIEIVVVTSPVIETGNDLDLP